MTDSNDIVRRARAGQKKEPTTMHKKGCRNSRRRRLGKIQQQVVVTSSVIKEQGLQPRFDGRFSKARF